MPQDPKRIDIAEAIRDRVKELHPDVFTYFENNRAHITFEVSGPRQNMGRFGTPKKHWTINLTNRVNIRDRIKQVRVKVEKDGTFSFSEQQLAEKIEDIKKYNAFLRERQQEASKVRSVIPTVLPKGVRVDVDHLDLYSVTFKLDRLTAGQMLALVHAFENFQYSKEHFQHLNEHSTGNQKDV
jgi:hypothetical protein